MERKEKKEENISSQITGEKRSFQKVSQDNAENKEAMSPESNNDFWSGKINI